MRIPQKAPPSWVGLPEHSKLEGLELFFNSLSSEDIQEIIRAPNESYVHWDKFRFRQMPKGVDPKMVWTAVEMSRMPQFTLVPLTFAEQKKLPYWVPPQHQEWISLSDQKSG